MLPVIEPFQMKAPFMLKLRKAFAMTDFKLLILGRSKF